MPDVDEIGRNRPCRAVAEVAEIVDQDRDFARRREVKMAVLEIQRVLIRRGSGA